MIFISTPGRTMTTSLVVWMRENSDVFVVQEPMISKFIFLINNINYRTGRLLILEIILCTILTQYLKIINARHEKILYIDR